MPLPCAFDHGTIVRTSVVGLVAALVPACGQLLGLDYAVRSGDAGPSKTDDGGAVSTARESGIEAGKGLHAASLCGDLRLWDQTCATCAEEAGACAAYDTERTDPFVACLRDCGWPVDSRNDPSCLVGCRGEHPAATIASSVTRYPAFASQIANTKCGYDGACGLGDHWECVGDYAWQQAAAQRLLVRVSALQSSSSVVPLLSLRSCAWPDDCQGADAGTALPVATDQGYVDVTERLVTGWDHLEVVTREVGTVLYYLGRPVSGEEWLDIQVVEKARMVGWLDTIGLPVDPSKEEGVVVVMPVHDCVGAFAKGATLELQTWMGPGVEAAYSKSFELLPSPDLRSTDRFLSATWFVRVPRGSATITARSASGEIVSTAEVIVRTGAVTMLQMWPETLGTK